MLVDRGDVAVRAVRVAVRIWGMKIYRRAAHAWVTVFGR
jgi:hypothetical protein